MFVAHRHASHKWPISNVCRSSACVSQMADFFDPMKANHFYFIKDSFFQDFTDPSLMQNKEDGHGRPCFFVVEDSDGLFWMIPISSKVEKYKQIYKKKIQKSGKCDTICFANVLGQERAFLIQNMFPIKENYILSEYYQSSSNTPVMISKLESKIIIEKFKKVLALVKNGKKNMVFVDILSMCEELKKKKQ